jgi:Na+-transporting methylmalonyl-CoA/oxaloacetate decarboxylase gamma subunit
MMEWLSDNPERGESVLVIIAVAITVVVIGLGVVFLGRKRLVATILIAFTWLILAAIAIPSFIPARSQAFRNACINNLKQIRVAKAAWANAGEKSPTDIPSVAKLLGTFGTNDFLRHELVCPRGGKYTIGAVGENPTCSYADKGHRLE